jgi:hypothetical protein
MNIFGKRTLVVLAGGVCLASGMLAAQTGFKRPEALPPADAPASAPAAITGLPSSARHCVSGDAANVHAIGWFDVGTSYTIRFDSDIELATALGRYNLAGQNVSTQYGTPEFNAGANLAGTNALWVSGNGQAGCYTYQVTIRPPSTALAASAPPGTEPAPVQPSPFEPQVVQAQAITGLASSARHCVSGSYVGNVHEIGRIEANNRVTITFDSDFNPIAGVGLIEPVARRQVYYHDDNSGGSNQPRLVFTAPHGGTLALYVASTTNIQGCYRYKVEIQ